jgi:hypothetical protein
MNTSKKERHSFREMNFNYFKEIEEWEVIEVIIN